jgi:zinc transport system substrate-binding protein
MKKTLTFLIAAVLLIFLLTGCSPDRDKDVPAVESAKSDKIQVVATLFPQYDFTRQIAGDKAEVTLLLPPGVESHSYEPTPSDVIKISQSDLFIYTGKYMEAWSGKIIDGMKDSGSDSYVLDVSQGIDLLKSDDVDAEHPYDPHIWTDPLIAKEMAANIRDALCRIDPVNAEYYKANAAKYSDELDALDAQFRAIMSGGKRSEIIFGSRFALYYFAKEYGLSYKAAFDSCSSETEPSARTVAGLIKEIKDKKIPVIYYAEIEDPKVAKSISAETGTKLLLFHSCHNVTKEELESGATYLSLMKQNAENLKEGLE